MRCSVPVGLRAPLCDLEQGSQVRALTPTVGRPRYRQSSRAAGGRTRHGARDTSSTCIADRLPDGLTMTSATSTPIHPATLLLADPCHALATSLSRDFRALGIQQVWYAENADEACNLAALMRPDLAVLELRFQDHEGLALLREIRSISPSTTCVILTAYGSMEAAARAVRLGAVACLAKPTSAREILDHGMAGAIEGPLPPLRHMSLQRATWEYLQRVFEGAPSVSEAARRLGVDRSSLRRMLSRPPPAR
jgi:two-component system, response regulator RegA